MLGSSTIIFGLMGMCLVWAPRNEVTCIVWLRFTPDGVRPVDPLVRRDVHRAGRVLGGDVGRREGELTNLSPGVIVAMALDHTFGAILGQSWWRRDGQAPAGSTARTGTCSPSWSGGRVGRRAGCRRPGKLIGWCRRSIGRGEGHSPEERKRRVGRVQSAEDRSAAPLRSFRHHLELRETEAALAVYQKARRSGGLAAAGGGVARPDRGALGSSSGTMRSS